MGGFFLLFVIAPLTGVLLLVWWGTNNNIYGKIAAFIWIGLFALFALGTIVHLLTDKTNLTKKDYYGQYVVNRDYFPGRQADWQYETFRFEIKDNDSMYFYVTDKEKILQTYRGTITTTRSYSSARLIINMSQPTHHILTGNPTTYRSAWSFYLVFNSPKFNNVYFKKGQWQPLDK